MYGISYYDFGNVSEANETGNFSQSDWSDEDDSDTDPSNTVNQDALPSTVLDNTATLSLEDSNSTVLQPDETKSLDSDASSGGDGAMLGRRYARHNQSKRAHGKALFARHRKLLKARFFKSSYPNPDRSKLGFHGDMYQCAENLQIPSLTAAITANASKIFFESVGRPSFAADLIHLFRVDFDDTSFLDEILDLCINNIGLLLRNHEFAQELLERSPFTGHLLIKLLMSSPSARFP